MPVHAGDPYGSPSPDMFRYWSDDRERARGRNTNVVERDSLIDQIMTRTVPRFKPSLT